jgi:Fe-S cluster assembly scaffold protein SufB
MHEKKCTVGTCEGIIRGGRESDKKSVFFSGQNTEEIGSLFFEHTEKIEKNLSFVFQENTKKMFFFRVENFLSAEISLNISVENNCEIFFVFLLRDTEHSIGKIKIQTSVAQGSVFHSSCIHLAEGKTELEKTVFLQEKNAHANTIFTELGGKKANAETIISHQSHASETSGDIRTRCILGNNAKSSITGIPQVGLNAENCVSHLDQKTILLSPAARSISVPQLNIANNKVEASHKSSFVHLSAEDEFYLQSRGISKRNIADLLLDGMLSETLASIPEEAVKTCLAETSHSFLHSLS